jgi:hypothetical protein
MSDFNTSAEARTHLPGFAPDGSSMHGRIKTHRVLRAPVILAVPPGEIQPDDFIELNDESMTPPSHRAADHP